MKPTSLLILFAAAAFASPITTSITCDQQSACDISSAGGTLSGDSGLVWADASATYDPNPNYVHALASGVYWDSTPGPVRQGWLSYSVSCSSDVGTPGAAAAGVSIGGLAGCSTSGIGDYSFSGVVPITLGQAFEITMFASGDGSSIGPGGGSASAQFSLVLTEAGGASPATAAPEPATWFLILAAPLLFYRRPCR